MRIVQAVKINSLKLSNFGLYANENNCLDFSSTCGLKPIILIGGANGRGKTTILEAILLCLYGNKSYAFLESFPLPYSNYLAKYINRTNDNKASKLELNISVIFEGKKTQLTVIREWTEKEKNVKEAFSVFRNGQYDRLLTDDWINQIEYIMPVSLSKFFLFDGERVAELMQDDSDKKIADAIKTLLGLDVIDQLDVDLSIITSKNKTYKEIERSDVEIRDLHQKKDEVSDKIKMIALRQLEIKQNIEEHKKEVTKLQDKFSRNNGTLFANREEVSLSKTETEKEQKDIIEQIYEIASGYFPLLLVNNLIKQTLQTALTQEKKKSEAQEIAGIEKFLAQIKNMPDEISKAFSEKKRVFEELANHNFDFGISALGIEQLRNLSEISVDSELNFINEIFCQKAVFEENLSITDIYLERDVNSDEVQTTIDEILSINKIIAKLEAEDERLTEDNNVLRKQRDTLEKQLNDIMLKYIDSGDIKDSAERLLAYSIKIKKVLSEYKLSVQEMKVDNLSRIVTEKFNKIISKKSLINEIIFDKDSLVMSLFNERREQVFKKQLSAGEKQLLSTAIIWGIIECSGQEFPMIIDTPLARLDHIHRELFVKNYLPKAAQQVIIFSTDAEIIDPFKGRLERYIAKKYLLEYSEENNATKISPDRYFGI